MKVLNFTFASFALSNVVVVRCQMLLLFVVKCCCCSLSNVVVIRCCAYDCLNFMITLLRF